jgi:hypothetical protein
MVRPSTRLKLGISDTMSHMVDDVNLNLTSTGSSTRLGSGNGFDSASFTFAVMSLPDSLGCRHLALYLPTAHLTAAVVMPGTKA